MRFQWLLVLLFGFAGLCWATSASAKTFPLRTWHDSQGRELQAQYVRTQDDKVVLVHGANVTVVPLAALSPLDQAYVQSLASTMESIGARGTALPDANASAPNQVEKVAEAVAERTEAIAEQASGAAGGQPAPDQSAASSPTTDARPKDKEAWEEEALKRGTDFSMPSLPSVPTGQEVGTQFKEAYSDSIEAGKEAVQGIPRETLVTAGSVALGLIVAVVAFKKIRTAMRRAARRANRDERSPHYDYS